MYKTSHRKESTRNRLKETQTLQKPTRTMAKTGTVYSLLSWCLIVLSLLGFTANAALANQATAKSRIQIVKTASVDAYIPPARLIESDSAGTGNTSIPFCLVLNAPYSVSISSETPLQLSEASGHRKVDANARVADDSIYNQSTDCLTHPHMIDIAIDQQQWELIDEGQYAGTLRVIINVE